MRFCQKFNCIHKMRKNFFLLLLSCLFTQILFAQDTIFFKGDLEISELQKMPLTLYIVQNDSSPTILLGSPSQSKELFKADKIKLTNDSVKANFNKLSIKLRMKYDDDKKSLKGSFKQGFLQRELVLTRMDKVFQFSRPQTPKPPFEYNIKELTFSNPECKYLFHGTLTFPQQTDNKKKFPVIVLVSGSGCQNRDSEIFLHKPFMVIADYLTKQGFAVFRYDDRGYGSKDSLMYKGTTLDFANDALSAIKMLQNETMIDKENIFVLGHSEGGLIAQILASQNKDIKAIILLAAPSINGKEILISQTEKIMQLNGASKENINRSIEEISTVKYDTSTINGLWLNCFYNLEPKEYIKNIDCNVLILQGGKDAQVLQEKNIPVFETILKDKATIKTYPNLNHLFQDCTSGSPNEYATITQTISPQVLNDITLWLKKQVELPKKTLSK